MSLSQARSDALRDGLEDLGISVIESDEQLATAIAEGADNHGYRALVALLANGIAGLSSTQATIAASEEGDADAPAGFLIELSSFLQEYGCPYRHLRENASRLDVEEDRILLMEFLISELQACRMSLAKHGPVVLMDTAEDTTAGAAPADHLQHILAVLQLPPAPGASVEQIFTAITEKIKTLLVQVGGADYLREPLLKTRLTPAQWEVLSTLNARLAEEYAVRRRMLLKRVDVTIQSFKWSDRAKSKLDQIEAASQPLRRSMTAASAVDVQDILFATDDLLRLDKTSNAEVRARTSGKVHGVVIGKVPDRGGRPNESRPPPEMPGFRRRTTGAPKPQRDGGGGGRRGGGGGGGGGGGRRHRVQGGWSDAGGGGGGVAAGRGNQGAEQGDGSGRGGGGRGGRGGGGRGGGGRAGNSDHIVTMS